MTDIFVRTTGNDTTGTGLTGAPYATLKKALTVAAAGDFIYIGDGTYAEDSGSGYLNIANAFASRVTIAPESGVPGKVTITGTSATYAIYLTNALNVHFDALTFEGQASVTNAVMRLVNTGSSAGNIRFTRCAWRVRSIAGSSAVACVTSAWTVAATVLAGITFEGCTFDQIGPHPANGILLDNSGAGSVISDIRIQGCTFNFAYLPCRLLGITNARIEDNSMTSWSPLASGTTLAFGVDGATGALCTGVISGNKFRTINGHAAVIGAGCNGVVVLGNTFYGGENASSGQGLVVKNALNVRIERNIIHSGYLSGLYFKAAQDCQAFNNIVYNRHANSPALRIGQNSEDSSTCARLTVRRNYFHATAGTVLGIEGASGDTGGSHVDENVYVVTGTATLGSVRSNTVTKLSELRAAWSGYDRPVNDRNSRLGQTHGVFSGTPFVDLPA